MTRSGVPAPPDPFEADTHTLAVGTKWFRIFEANPDRDATTHNPGFGKPTRFAFFGNPHVPVLYAAETEEAAVCETLLHDIPVTGGVLTFADYSQRVMGRVEVVRPLALASLKGTALRWVQISAEDVPSAPPTEYHLTVAWAKAAYDAGFDGLVWMSYRCNDALAIVLFERPGQPSPLRVDPTFGRIFSTSAGHAWLSDLCAPMHIEVMPPA